MIRRAVAVLWVIAALSVASSVEAADEASPSTRDVRPIRLLVPSIGVDAPVVELGTRPDGSMEAPQGPEPVAWYRFSSPPGSSGNAVLSGHRDWHTGVSGVFWRLGEVAEGASVWIVLSDGARIDYVVGLSALIAPDQLPIEEIVGPTDSEMITIITCEGFFDPNSRDYDKRRIVRAGRAI